MMGLASVAFPQPGARVPKARVPKSGRTPLRVGVLQRSAAPDAAGIHCIIQQQPSVPLERPLS